MSIERASLLHPDLAGPVDVLWLAGEHSGDQHAARIAAHLNAYNPDLKQVAIGGPALASAEVPLLFDLTENSVVGLFEVIRHYGFFKRLFAEVIEWIRENKPRVVVLVDYPGFNLRLAEALLKAGLSRKAGGPVSIYYYISPQVWAWKGHRRFKMAKLIDELGVIFPFELETFADTDLTVHFVGHPFLDPMYEPMVRYDAAGALLLLPGSRIQAVKRIFPAMLDAVEVWRERNEVNCEVALTTVAPNESVAAELKRMLDGRDLPVVMQRDRRVSDACMVLTSSGTMSLACALSGAPGTIVYRAHPMTYFLARCLVKVPFIGIANLILKRAMYPEFIQGAATPEVLADELEDCMTDARKAQTKSDQKALRMALSTRSSATAADRILALMNGPK